MLSLERTSVDKMTRGCLEDAAIVHLIILLLVVILGRLDLFLFHLLGLLLTLAVQLSPTVHLISLGILKLSGLRKKNIAKRQVCTSVLDCN